jgi:hypothetical protein
MVDAADAAKSCPTTDRCRRSSDEIDSAAFWRWDVARVDMGSGRGEELLVEVAKPLQQ